MGAAKAVMALAKKASDHVVVLMVNRRSNYSPDFVVVVGSRGVADIRVVVDVLITVILLNECGVS